MERYLWYQSSDCRYVGMYPNPTQWSWAYYEESSVGLLIRSSYELRLFYWVWPTKNSNLMLQGSHWTLPLETWGFLVSFISCVKEFESCLYSYNIPSHCFHIECLDSSVKSSVSTWPYGLRIYSWGQVVRICVLKNLQHKWSFSSFTFWCPQDARPQPKSFSLTYSTFLKVATWNSRNSPSNISKQTIPNPNLSC